MALIHEQLIKVMQGVTGVAKRDRNYQQQFSFRGIDAVLNAVGPVLREHGVFLAPMVENIKYETVEVGRNRTPMAHVLVTVQYTFFAADGSELAVEVVGEAMDSGDKAVSKAMSVALRTALLQTLALPTDEKDPDADAYTRSEPQVVREESRAEEVVRKAGITEVAEQAAAPVEDEDATNALRNVILTWAARNRIPPRQIASDFAADFGHPIQQGTEEELNTFYAKLTLGGKTEAELRTEVANA